MPFLFNELTGGAGELAAYRTADPRVVDLRRVRRRNPARPLTNPQLNFQEADRLYSIMPAREKCMWRVANTHPCKSGYDLWMMHAIPCIAARRLPPSIPPTAGGFSPGCIPPGIHYPYATSIPYLHNQTCYGTVRWHSTDPTVGPVFFWVVVDLDHPDDNNVFKVELHFYLLWSDLHQKWLCAHVNVEANNHEILGPFRSDSPVGYDPPYPGWIDLTYGNLHQRVRVHRDEPMRTPVNPCYSGHSHVAIQNRDNEHLDRFGFRELYPAPATAILATTVQNLYEARHGHYQQHYINIHFHDDTNTWKAMLNYHVLGFYSPHWGRLVFDFHSGQQLGPIPCWKTRSKPWDWFNRIYALEHYQGTMFSWNRGHNMTSRIGIGEIPPTPTFS